MGEKLSCMVTDVVDSFIDALATQLSCLTCGMIPLSRVESEKAGKGEVTISFCKPGKEGAGEGIGGGLSSGLSSCGLCGGGPGYEERAGVTYTPIRP